MTDDVMTQQQYVDHWDRLAGRARLGDDDAFTQLVERFDRQLYAFAYRQVRDADIAAEMTQETWIKAYRAIGRTEEGTNVNAWLHRICVNACLDWLRRRQRLRFGEWEPTKHDHLLRAERDDQPEEATIKTEATDAVRRTLDRMSERHRTALMMREYQGMSCEEIGQVMDLSRSAVKSMLFRAREEFRRVYRKDPTAPDVIDRSGVQIERPALRPTG
jgi:RNA polymerase sigma-70 factor (ECF subfamily)